MIEGIAAKLAELEKTTKFFPNIDLTVEEQTWQRAKPRDYLFGAIDLFKEIGGKVIVEIGCMRSPMKHSPDELVPACCNAGHSSWFFAKTGAEFHSVDISWSAVRIAKKACREFPNAHFYRKDGIKFLANFAGTIDLLFLDAWDVTPKLPFAEKHLEAYQVAKPKLAARHIISIDDTDVGGGGKGRLVIPQLKQDGYRILVQGRQTVAINF